MSTTAKKLIGEAARLRGEEHRPGPRFNRTDDQQQKRDETFKAVINAALFYQRCGLGVLHSYKTDALTKRAIDELEKLGYLQVYQETSQAELIKEFVRY